MFSIWTIASITLVYLGVLFFIAVYANKRKHLPKAFYGLAMGVHCTSWAFFGTTTQASTFGWAFVPTYLGIILVMLFAYPSLCRIAEICRQHKISSLADFIGIRFNHSNGLAALVTLICIVGVVPYIALQLDAITLMLSLISTAQADLSQSVGFYVAALMALFAILFGTRTLDLTEKHRGLMATIAFESVVKLLALCVLGLYVVYVLFDGPLDLFAQSLNNDTSAGILRSGSSMWIYFSHIVLGICSMFCLPRQFHINFVENNNEQELRMARWLFPLYLVGMTIFVLPIALAGHILLPEGRYTTDSFVLSVPIAAQNASMAIVAFIGGLSAATSMVIVATLALGIMIANNLVTPLWFRTRARLPMRHRLSAKNILRTRQVTVVLVLSIAYWYHVNVSQSASLVKSGTIAISLLAQTFPAIIIGLYWQKASKSGAIAGLLIGALLWAYYLLYPSVMAAYYFSPAPSDQALANGFFISIIANIAVFALVSAGYSAKTRGLAKSPDSKSPYLKNPYTQNDSHLPSLLYDSSELNDLLQGFLPAPQYARFCDEFPHNTGNAGADMLRESQQLLAANIGSASAQILLATIAKAPQVGEQAQRPLNQWMEHKISSRTLSLQQEKNQAQRASDSKSKFLAAASHDLMQPFNAASLYAALLDQKVTQSEHKTLTKGLVSALENADELLSMLLDMSKLESGLISPKMQCFAINDLLLSIQREFRLQAQEKGIDLRIVPSAIYVETDRKLLSRIIQNLVSNAVRYTPHGKILLGLRRRANQQCEICVVDTGSGIALDQQAKIFDEFTQLSVEPSNQGLGLGLTIVDRMSALLGHTIRLRSCVGQGTQFGVVLQVAPHTPSPKELRPEKDTDSTSILAQRKVLIIENDKDIAQALQQALISMGADVMVAHSKEHAEQYDLSNIDLVIADYHLDDGKNGIDAYKQLFAEGRRPNAILSSADISHDIRDLAGELNMHYLPKPIKLPALKRVLRKLFQLSQ